MIKIATFTSSAFSTSNTNIKYRLVITEKEQSIVSNTTKINVKLQAWRTNDFSTYGSGTAFINLNGTEYSQAINYTQRIELNSYTVLFDQDFTITHAINGEKPMSIGGRISHSQFSSSEQTYSFNLTRIPRASPFVIADSSLFFGETLRITITRADASFIHDIKITFGSYSQSYTNIVATANFTIPDLWAGAIPNSLTGTGTVTVTTKQNNVKLGSVSHSYTVTAPSDMLPTFTSISTTPNPAYFSSYYVQGKSAIDIEIVGASGIYGSGIRSYSISTTTNFNSADRTATTPVITVSGNVTITAKVTDTRGRVATKTKTVSVTAYSVPTLSAIVERVDAEGNYSTSGDRIKIQPTVTITSLNGNNNITVLRYRKKRKIDTYFGSWVNMTNNGAYYFSADISYAYDVEIEYADAISDESLYSVIVPSEKRIMDIFNGGEGVVFGAAATQEKVFDIQGGWKALYNGNEIMTIIEEGFNDDGSWIKFSNGLMIQRHKVMVKLSSIPHGTALHRLSYQWYFPLEFQEIYLAQINKWRYSTATTITSNGNNLTSTAVFYCFLTGASTGTVTSEIEMFAFGTWK